MNQQFLTELKAVTAENRIFTDEPMKKHTTFRVGGPADILVQPKGTELAAVIRLCRKYDVPYQVIGNGSNLLVGDRGIRGLVIEMLSKEDEICVEDDCITVGAGMLLSKTANRAAEHGLTGMEFAAGIPGRIGGAVVMNAGAYVTGSQLKRLGEYYAKAIHDNYGLDFDVLFGPAYKGIPLSVVTAIAIHDLYGVEVRYCSNRKEAKDHGGDAGLLLGSKIKDGDRVVIIEDVTTSGKSIEETFPIIQAQGNVEIKGLMVSLNRMEVGKGDKCALDEIKELYGMQANAIVTMEDVITYLYNRPCQGKIQIDDKMKAAIDAYYEEYGVK